MVKLFVGNLGDAFTVTSNELRVLFEKYGSVSECERVKNYAFVHMDDLNAAQDALNELNGTLIKGKSVPRQQICSIGKMCSLGRGWYNVLRNFRNS